MISSFTTRNKETSFVYLHNTELAHISTIFQKYNDFSIRNSLLLRPYIFPGETIHVLLLEFVSLCFDQIFLSHESCFSIFLHGRYLSSVVFFPSSLFVSSVPSRDKLVSLRHSETAMMAVVSPRRVRKMPKKKEDKGRRCVCVRVCGSLRDRYRDARIGTERETVTAKSVLLSPR